MQTCALVLDGAECRVQRGRDGRCHEDAANRYYGSIDTRIPLRITTGWAFGDQAGDGIWRTRAKKRAYFVWRVARFHGGADVTLPITPTSLSSLTSARPPL